ncbi:MAG: 3-keto-5-aminohexanoate cleavage protein [Proteobacteria bacterium]|nr:3-keto-5-aminohexanoate cleavage protein [Desulfobacterales bacterium]MBL6968303.1 3-keto-5-aminohexanoate cleavage protein [Desulfobacteraceae bacterium]MBU0735961.1 3-keto-5-aminohexanoate cleavage protein [Pseudomonadota bacterium]MBL7102074.1 3-keto-5-aminohexanoate cleavage protein [Desulfobacteraceae bacterium]MBL7172453.1 3-keto-5-aminohexanoate cleavage protein [Desulfobacteraceae bacterium]
MSEKTVITCALTGLLTDPAVHRVPVTPEEMADHTQQAYNAGATIVHCHFRNQEKGMGHLPTWDLDTVGDILGAIKERVPEIIICMSTGVVGPDISGPAACLEKYKPEMAACNAGSLNYLKLRSNGSWAWPPMLFDNPVEKVKHFLDVMTANGVVPEFECFDSGIVRSVGLYKANGMFEGDPHISCVMGVASGMPAKPEWLPLLVKEMIDGTHYQVIAVGREEVWDLHRKCVELGGNVRTGLEDTFYLPNNEKARSNGELVEALANIVREVGHEIASPSEARKILGLRSA